MVFGWKVWKAWKTVGFVHSVGWEQGDTPFPLSPLSSHETGGVVSNPHLDDLPYFTSNINFVHLRLLHTVQFYESTPRGFTATTSPFSASRSAVGCGRVGHPYRGLSSV